MDLPDIEAEIMEGRRELSSGALADPEPLPRQTAVPLVGSSLAMARSIKHEKLGGIGVATLGGYVAVNGKVYGLTNHHVCFGPWRLSAYPSEPEELGSEKPWMLQPAELDVERALTSLNTNIKYLKGNSSASDQVQIDRFESELSQLQIWNATTSNIGRVFRSSGFKLWTGIITPSSEWTGH